jgi:hypothetical protein
MNKKFWSRSFESSSSSNLKSKIQNRKSEGSAERAGTGGQGDQMRKGGCQVSSDE